MNKTLSLSLLLVAQLCSYAQSEEVPQIDTSSRTQTTNQTSSSFFSSFDGIFESMKKEMEHMHQRMAELEQSFFVNSKSATPNLKSTYAHNIINISETDNHVILSLNVPGIKSQELKDIELEHNTLYAQIPLEYGIIEAVITPQYAQVIQRAQKAKEDSKNNQHQAFSAYSSSQQAISLPALVNLSTAQAELDEEVLTITIGKKAPTKVSIAQKHSAHNDQKPLNDQLADLK